MFRTTLRFVLALAALAAGLAHAADRREERPVGPFTELSLVAPIDVELVQGERESLVLQGPAEVVDALETRVDGGKLEIRMKPVISFSWGRTRALVTVRSIAAISVSGSGDVKAAALKAEGLRIAIDGSGDVRVASLDARRVDASIVGSGDIEVAGRADTVAVSVQGSGDVRAAGLEAREVRVAIAGSGDAQVWARESLVATIAGSGDVRYRGEPRVQPSVLGSGSVKRLRG